MVNILLQVTNILIGGHVNFHDLMMKPSKFSRLIDVNDILFQTGFIQSLEFLKKSWNLPSNFPDLEKVSKIEIESGKNGKKFFWKVQQVLLHWNFSLVGLVKSYLISPVCLQCILDKALFVPFLRSPLMLTYFDNLEFRKRNYSFAKSLEKILNFGSKNLYKPWKLSLSNCNPFHISCLECCIP